MCFARGGSLEARGVFSGFALPCLQCTWKVLFLCSVVCVVVFLGFGKLFHIRRVGHSEESPPPKEWVRIRQASQISGEGDIALSFSGCGFLGAYHFGVLQGLSRDGKALIKRVKRCAGASAGSLVAALWALLPNDAERGFDDVVKMAAEIHALRFGALSPNFLLHKRLQKLVEDYVPEDISPAQGRLYISVTQQKGNINRLISQFPSRDYLIDCLLASCYIPVYSGASAPVIDGDQYIDGGFTNNLPTFEELPTVTISPFSGNAVIAPNDRNPAKPFREWRLRLGTQELKVNVQNMVRGAQALFPPSVELLNKYYEMGQRDAMMFLLSVGVLERQVGDAV